jgi:hypothetical protein
LTTQSPWRSGARPPSIEAGDAHGEQDIVGRVEQERQKPALEGFAGLVHVAGGGAQVRAGDGAARASPHDALFRFTFSQPEHAAPLIRSKLQPELARSVDWSSLELRPGSFVDRELEWRHTDLLFGTTAAQHGLRRSGFAISSTSSCAMLCSLPRSP